MKYFCKKVSEHKTVYIWPKDQYIGDYIEFTIAGILHRDNVSSYKGENVGTLEAEPTNEYDSNAIKILSADGHHVGYVPKNITQQIRDFTILPCKCYFYIGTYKKDGGTCYFSDCYINR